MKRAEILYAAKEIVSKNREQDYGPPENNFTIIANLWNAYLGSNEITPEDVAIMMALLKIGRIRTGNGKADNYIDLAGYAACAGEIGSPAVRKD